MTAENRKSSNTEWLIEKLHAAERERDEVIEHARGLEIDNLRLRMKLEAISSIVGEILISTLSALHILGRIQVNFATMKLKMQMRPRSHACLPHLCQQVSCRHRLSAGCQNFTAMSI